MQRRKEIEEESETEKRKKARAIIIPEEVPPSQKTVSNILRRKRVILNGPAKASSVPWFTIKNQAEKCEICIYEQIGKDWWSGEGTEGKAFAEELQKVPKNQEILLRINSPGGNVHDGLLIYNLLDQRRDKVTCQVDGVAISAASFIACAGHKLIMPKNALFMIHDPSTFADGNAEEMRRVADMLDKHRDSIASIYEKKTGAKRKDIERWMAETTWYTGDEAKEAKFADEVTDEISISACVRFDVSGFKRVPEQIKNQINNKKENMNRAAVIARLKQLGIEFDNDATDEVLQGLLDEAETKAKADAKAKADKEKKDKAAKAAKDKAAREAAAAESSEEEESEEEEEETPAASRAGTRTRGPKLANRLLAIEAKYERERKANVTAAVQKCVDNDQIPGAQADEWIADILAADEAQADKILARLQAMPSRPPGHAGVGIVIEDEDPRAVERAVLNLRAPIESARRGNDVDPKVISANGMAIALTIYKNRKRLDTILATNTVDPALKRNVILTDVLRAFKRRITLLSVFATTFRNVPLQGTNKITIPFYDLDTSASKDFNAAVGYLFDEDTIVGVREITINKRKYKSMDFTSEQFRRTPYFRPDIAIALKAEQLALDVWLDILSIVTASNFPTVALNEESGNFDSDDMAVLSIKGDNADWPDLGRAAVLGTDRKQGLLQDDAIKHWQNIGSTDPVREGATGRLSGFDMFFSPRIPTNSEDLGGFITMPQAILVATSPIMPAPGVMHNLLSYDVVVDPDLGMALEYRYGADEWKDTDREVVEFNYGYAKGNGSALQRILNGAGEASSSSSASSVNSSSSSSSSPSF